MSSQELVPAGSHTLVINEPDTTRAIMLMDSHDLEQAMAELRGEVLATFVYRPKGAKPQLTYAGVKEAARLYRNVHFGATAVPLPDGTWMITSYAHNLADNTRVDYPMPYPAFDLANQEQAIKFRANLSKSLRNALAAVLPVAYLQTMIERWLEQGNEGRAGQPPRLAERPAQARGAGLKVTEAVTVPVPEPAPEDDPHADLRAEVVALLAEDGPALALLQQQGKPLPPEQDAATLAKTKTWLLVRAKAGVPQVARLAARVAQAGTRDEVRLVLADARRAQERKEVTEGEYKELCAAGETHSASLEAGPLTAQAQGRAQLAS